YRRIGLLTHQTIARKEGQLRKLLGDPYAGRLQMIDYFHSGKSRGSNEWIDRCDALVLFGTPRVPPSAVREHLLRTSRYSAAKLTLQQAGWSLDDDGGWYGRKDNGRKCVVCTPRYRDPDWHRACCALVRSELLQSVGRGRAILPEGIPVFVVTRENLGDPTI